MTLSIQNYEHVKADWLNVVVMIKKYNEFQKTNTTSDTVDLTKNNTLENIPSNITQSDLSRLGKSINDWNHKSALIM